MGAPGRSMMFPGILFTEQSGKDPICSERQTLATGLGGYEPVERRQTWIS